ncbi:PREDICTED: tubulin-specific chaperone cofactor E-like protein [Rhagoletis zephyria]|uniref:tubulin-specific chaperone cofactor E-like protein n=1 Tax=Rhagoletis zephyria TaxID=28612 RepID=UPI0008117DE0|nr:PREDICTED: tubulin-specific chaperone cofactor E-like protein [Rhagoletis zephyria]
MPSLLEALERKYFTDCQLENLNGDDTAAEAEKGLISIYIPRLPPLLCVPELLVLNDCDIDCAGDFEAIKEKCRRVRELDLAQNKLNDWQEVFHILEHMPRVEFLNLSKNHLVGPICNPSTLPTNSLKSMVLNGTYLDWPSVEVLLDNLPLLEELHLSLNDYKEVLIDSIEFAEREEDVAGGEVVSVEHADGEVTERNERNDNKQSDSHNLTATTAAAAASAAGTTAAEAPETEREIETETPATPPPTPTSPTGSYTESKRKRIRPHRKLKTLHFTGNPVESWLEICRLGRVFPSLENLVLADCPIKAIQANVGNSGNGSSTTAAANNNTDEDCTTACEDDVEMSNKAECPHKHFHNLLFLNLSYSNISAWDDIDQIAKFPKLRNLRVKNWPLWERLECTEHERRQLLIARLPNVCLLNGGGVISADEREDAERAFIRHYMDKPDWERPKRYDELVAKHGKLDPLVNINLKPDKRLKVFITYKDKTETRLLDVYCTVADLKTRLEKLIDLPANKMRLYYVDQDFKEFGPELMKYPNKRLYSYNIQAGDEIIIDEKK